DLGSYLRWCFEQGVRPLQAQRGHVELDLRWLQEVRRLKPFTVSRRLRVLATFYRTCVIDGILEHSPAEYVRRPPVPPESPTLGLSHLQFEAMLSAGRDSANPNDFALVAMLGLLGLRIFEATGSDVTALGEARGHRVLKVLGKGDKTAALITLRPAVGRRGPCGVWTSHRRDAAQPCRPAHGPSRRHSPTPRPGEGRRRHDGSHTPTHA